MVESSGSSWVGTSFDRESINETLPSSHFLHPLPILTDTQSEYILEEKGRGFFLWNDTSGWVFKIKERTLEDILKKLKARELDNSCLSRLRAVDDPSVEPDLNIPYLPNPDFVDRPDITEQFRIPPKKTVVFHGLHGSG